MCCYSLFSFLSLLIDHASSAVDMAASVMAGRACVWVVLVSSVMIAMVSVAPSMMARSVVVFPIVFLFFLVGFCVSLCGFQSS